MLIDFVADGISIEAPAKIGDERELALIEHLRRRIHRRIDEDELGARREGGLEPIARQGPVRRLEPHQLRDSPRPLQDRQVAVVKRLDEHGFVPRLNEREERAGQGFGGPQRDQDFGIGIEVEAVEAFVVRGERAAKFRQAEERRVLVRVRAQGAGGEIDDVRGTVPAGRTLAEVDGAVLAGKPRHRLENRDAVGGQN